MRGTFRTGDHLSVRPCKGNEIRQGDVIVYDCTSRSGKKIAHRVCSVSSNWIKTRGDALALPDGTMIAACQVTGRVVSLVRNNRHHRLIGGRFGVLHAFFCRLVLSLRRLAAKMLDHGYWPLGKQLVKSSKWSPTILRVSVQGPAGAIIKYVHASRTVAEWCECTGRWFCRKPYDLLLRRPFS